MIYESNSQDMISGEKGTKENTQCFSWFKTGLKVRLCVCIYLFLQKQTKATEGKTKQ